MLKPLLTYWRQLQRIPLFYKILIANSAVVGFGAVAGTIITVWHVSRYPEDVHYELIAVFAAVGVWLSFMVNRWVLKRALAPLQHLQAVVDQVRHGQTNIRVEIGPTSDEQFDRLADTFNQMLAEQEEYARRMKALPQQLMQVQEDERQRLSRELHDEAAQALTSLLVNLRLLERARDPERAQQQVQMLRELTAHALEDVRRVALDLRPTILDDLGLGPALEWRADEFTKASGVEVEVKISGLEKRLSRDVELVFYRVGQESLSNIGRHAQAKSVQLSLTRKDQVVQLRIKDDGVGFSVAEIPKNQPRGLGLLGMRERMSMINGSLEINTQPGQGTEILAVVRLDTTQLNGVHRDTHSRFVG